MDTNKENELMHNLEEKVGGGDTGHLPDGRPTRPGERRMTVNPPGSLQNSEQQGSRGSQNGQNGQNGQGGQNPAGQQRLFGRIGGQPAVSASVSANVSANISAEDEVTPEMVNRIEMYGTEAVYNAGEDS